MQLPDRVTELAATARDGLRVAWNAGVVRPLAPRPSLLRLAVQMPRRTPNLGSAVAFHAATRPRATAIVDDRGALTWRELDERCSQLANELLEHGGEGARVAFMLFNGRESVECYAGCGRAGATAVPVNTWSTPAELAHVVETQDPVVLVADREFADVVAEAAPDAPCLWVGTGGGHDAYERALAVRSARPPTVRGSARIVTHTSGTTGRPKGAERDVSGATITPFIRFLEKVPLRRTDRFLVAPPLFHSFGQGMAAVGIVLGTTLVLPRRFDPAGVPDLARRTGATAMALVPLMLKRMMDAGDPEPPESLRLVVLSGSPLPVPLRQQAEDTYGRIFYDLYGATEVGWATIATPEDQEARPGTVGRPGRGMTVFAADEEGSVLPPGVEGRLYVNTGFEFSGYTGVERDQSLVAGAMEFGDRGWVDEDGYVFVTGRADEMIISGGENVYPSEVEHALEDHPDLVDAAVVGVDDEEYGQVLHAFVVPVDGAEVSAEQVSDHVRERLSRYKAPKRVTFVDDLPRTPTGKVRKRDLPAEDAP